MLPDKEAPQHTVSSLYRANVKYACTLTVNLLHMRNAPAMMIVYTYIQFMMININMESEAIHVVAISGILSDSEQ